MKARILWFAAPALALGLVGCRCGDTVKRVPPVLAVNPVSLDFGDVKVGESATQPIALESQSKADVAITSVTIEGADTAAFKITGDIPQSVASLSSSNVNVTFTPADYAGYGAVLVVQSNDDEHPRIEVSLTGTGAKPIIQVVPECDPVARKCTGSVTTTPPLAIDFGQVPYNAQLKPPVSTLPDVSITNQGTVTLVVNRLDITGPDKSSFILQGNSTLPAGGLQVPPLGGAIVAIRFDPQNDNQDLFSATLNIGSDDPDHPLITVALTGTRKPNGNPVVCANIVKVAQGDSTVSNYGTAADWAPLIPPNGVTSIPYDFGSTREVQPNSTVYLSVISDPADERACTYDPDDGRVGVKYEWSAVSWPAGAPTPNIAGAGPNDLNTATNASLHVGALTGEYVLQLKVTDIQGHPTLTTVKFTVAIRQDLVAQVSWIGYPGIDLDVHLVRPSSATNAADPFSGAFSFFEEAPTGKTSGDVNGFSANYKRTNPGVDFEWGDIGTADDPKLNLDEQGNGPLVENVSVNYPEHDPKCAAGPCTYKVMVHYFKDARATLPDGGVPGACIVDAGSCSDGQRCNCADPATRCVANDAPANAIPTGAGKCFIPPQPVVRVFVKANPTPAAVIPLAGALEVPAPCQMLHVADVIWPQRTDGGIDAGAVRVIPVGEDDAGFVSAPSIQRFGVRQSGSTGCSPNITKAGSATPNWYAPAP